MVSSHSFLPLNTPALFSATREEEGLQSIRSHRIIQIKDFSSMEAVNTMESFMTIEISMSLEKGSSWFPYSAEMTEKRGSPYWKLA